MFVINLTIQFHSRMKYNSAILTTNEANRLVTAIKTFNPQGKGICSHIYSSTMYIFSKSNYDLVCEFGTMHFADTVVWTREREKSTVWKNQFVLNYSFTLFKQKKLRQAGMPEKYILENLIKLFFLIFGLEITIYLLITYKHTKL